MTPTSSLGRSRSRSQQGVALMESLVAMVVLAIAVFGVLGTQSRTVAETQTSVRRAQAVRLIEDFAERIKSNPDGYRQLPNYATEWDTPLTSVDCIATACDPSRIAIWDVAAWKRAVADTLPLGRATVFETSGAARHLGVLVAWKASARAGVDDDDLKHLAVDTRAPGVECPEGFLCHLAHVEP